MTFRLKVELCAKVQLPSWLVWKIRVPIKFHYVPLNGLWPESVLKGTGIILSWNCFVTPTATSLDVRTSPNGGARAHCDLNFTVSFT